MPVMRKKREKGFTLIEMLIVVAIIGIMAGIATVSVSTTLKKQRVEAAANQFQSFVESAAVHAKERSSGIFIWLHRDNAPGGGPTMWWYCYLIQDVNRNDILEFNIINPGGSPPGNGTDIYIPTEQMILPDDIVIAPSNGPATQPPPSLPGVWPGPNNWPLNPDDANDFLIMCDPRALPFNPNGPSQIQVPIAICLTHQEMIDGNLNPGTRYDITISPLWHTKLDRVLY